ncbi:ATP-binding cassette domain-containing protein [Bacillus infantis]|uniref:ATP-binding cassette domain-containing protein n=1 Tax=Bacillus infantis TaxID=324767 RepID=UPI00209CDFDE|nr:ABC transporter ATP-binding protein [Bacillus infantis]MCP1160377.1 ABC transporter ATP-binding protein [Bacillus infantis]
MLPIEITGLEKNIDGFKLGPLNASFEPGTITALIGNNSSGKSTLLKLLMNLAKRDKGDILINGQSISEGESWKQTIAYQSQTLNGVSTLTGYELYSLVSRWYPSWDKQLFDEIVNLFSVPLDKPYGKLSKGVQQKLNLALTLPRDTEILLLDEPSASMDIPAKHLLMEVLAKWMERGDKTMIIATHQAEDIRKLADYILFMKDGEITGHFEKDELALKFKKYWVGQLPDSSIPGEVSRPGDRMVITSAALEAERYFKKAGISILEEEVPELEEALAIMLQQPKQEKGWRE